MFSGAKGLLRNYGSCRKHQEMPIVSKRHVTTGHLRDESCLLCFLCDWVQAYFSDCFLRIVTVWWPQVLVWLGIFQEETFEEKWKCFRQKGQKPQLPTDLRGEPAGHLSHPHVGVASSFVLRFLSLKHCRMSPQVQISEQVPKFFFHANLVVHTEYSLQMSHTLSVQLTFWRSISKKWKLRFRVDGWFHTDCFEINFFLLIFFSKKRSLWCWTWGTGVCWEQKKRVGFLFVLFLQNTRMRKAPVAGILEALMTIFFWIQHAAFRCMPTPNSELCRVKQTQRKFIICVTCSSCWRCCKGPCDKCHLCMAVLLGKISCQLISL